MMSSQSCLLTFRKALSLVLGAAMLLEAPLALAAPAGSQVATSAANKKIVEDVATQLKRMKGKKTAFCFAVDSGAVTGVNENEPVRTASVTKTLTSYWAVKTLGPNYQFTTRIFVNAKTHEVHIAGSRDPYFDKDRLFVLLADLNRKGLSDISHLTVDPNFWFWDATKFRYAKGRGPKFSHREEFFISEAHTRNTVAGNSADIKAALEHGFNTPTWTDLQTRYAETRAKNPAAQLPPDVKMVTPKIDIVAANPLAGQPNVFAFDVRSAPLRMYLKVMNIYSSNPNAEELFFSLGGRPAFNAFMAREGFGAQANVNSGSGVNLSNSGDRKDTFVPCSTVVRVIQRMDEFLESQHLDLADVMMVAGKDNGTYKDPSNTIIAKTGTLLRPTKVRNLAGVKNTAAGQVYFGIFIDGRGANSGDWLPALSGIGRQYHGIQVKETPYAFSPIGAWTHMELLRSNAPAVSLAQK